MAFDKAVFEQYLKDGIPVLRLYYWSKPSFTYGVSQHPEDEINLSLCSLEGVECAKRMTGGGVLFHYDELTYSFVCSKLDLREPQNVFVSYRGICAFLIQFYKTLGLDAYFALEAEDFHNRSSPSPLCSASYEKYDVVINGKKIGGNAQKRARQAVFQHGSIPRSIDWGFVSRYLNNSLPQDIPSRVTTLRDELSYLPQEDILENKFIEAFANEFKVNFTPEEENIYETGLVK